MSQPTKHELAKAIAIIMQLDETERKSLEKASTKALRKMWNWLRLHSGQVGTI